MIRPLRAWFLISSASLALILWGSPRAKAACTCEPSTTEEQIERAVTVFTGTISEIHVDKKTQEKSVTFDVLDTFKGDPVDDMTLTDSEAGTDCAIDFKLKDNYLVYVRWIWGARVTSRCVGTKKMEQAASDAKVLGPGDELREDLYTKLQPMCMGTPGAFCCLASLRAMEKGHYLPEPEAGCPDTTVPDRLRCGGSMRWCIPTSDKPAEHP